MSKPFSYLIQVTPLGLLYGSAGRFLSPENLVGRSGNHFPPSSATLSGLYAQQQTAETKEKFTHLQIAGPFWAKEREPQNFFVPTPLNYLVPKEKSEIAYKLSPEFPTTENETIQWLPQDPAKRKAYQEKPDKFSARHWLAIKDWNKAEKVHSSPWKFLPHLHPRLAEDQRRVEQDGDQGSLFLENSVQLGPDVCLIYLTNHPLEDGWYRFGGEGHMVDIRSLELDGKTQELLNEPVGEKFALITSAVWGSNRFSERFPEQWSVKALLTDRASPFRYRLGGTGKTKRLSRGRHTVPAGTVYVLEEPIDQPWHDWSEEWFPKEGYSFNRWGCGLALPIAV
ncbi:MULTISPECIES: type III-B CRISPR module-associated protein Cmr3 [unclassified Synechocystis]|uniref:type III-B CRISPR module-associated protein Cmr3 n=1 Tax=unclassified Synechocystis TaxID=2640012 RepID=UPI001EE650A1|nr:MULTISPECIES: type III-B CRISPR module-associated protein Cmr3 [unclassified Synechocystis]